MSSSSEADDLAVVLGLKSDPLNNVALGLQERVRHRRFMVQLHNKILVKTEQEQDRVWSKFCALYLPGTVDRLLDLPVPADAETPIELEDFIVFNPWHETLVQLQHIPYLAKYLRSHSPIAAPGKQLLQVLADRLAGVSASWEAKMAAVPRNQQLQDHYIAAAGSAIQLLCTLCTHFVHETNRNSVISNETQQRLLPILSVWSHRYNRQFLGIVSRRMLAYISRAPGWEQAFNSVRSSTKNWGVCGLPLCSVRKDLRVCAKCQTVRYVRPSFFFFLLNAS
ncbi:hypothetical protein B0H16DRAFT_429815 [Mycena metata]|uniref:Uncharacterized protein n=1 Tax=Mycena metata TaxID=1033252 RepID=A0AAD7JIX6_9AGAR|nr:hypothetical protein B0H16DRAFT_429815 [Mycena metata]